MKELRHGGGSIDADLKNQIKRKTMMKLRHSLVLTALLVLAGGPAVHAQDPFSSIDRAKRHALQRDRPATDFFEGALLGNGGMGVVVTTRPDAVVLYFGHNKVWDIRLAEDHREEIGTFDEIFEKVRRRSEPLTRSSRRSVRSPTTSRT